MKRPQIKESYIEEAFEQLRKELDERRAKHGDGLFISDHEILGKVAEEYDELKDAVRGNDRKHVQAELLDVAIGALFGYMSIEQQTYDRESQEEEVDE